MPPFMVRWFALAEKEALHILRDRQVLYLALAMPVLLVVLFGYAVSFDVDSLPVWVVDQDHTAESRAFSDRIQAADVFEVVPGASDPEAIEFAFRSGKIKAAFIIPQGYARRLVRGEQGQLQLLLDGADGTTARIVLGYAAALADRETLRLLQAEAPPLEVRLRTWFNPRMESAVFVVPGLVAVVLSIMAVLLAALTVAREWERGSMEQLFATPVNRLAVVLGKLAPYVALGLLQFFLVLVAGAWLFEVPLLGSFATLFVALLLFLICALGQGLLISMVTKSQQLATQIGAVSAILPALLLSGFLFPVENMPPPLWAISHLVPARWFVATLRGVLLQDRGFEQLWPQLLGLLLLAILIVGGSTARFRRRLD